MGNQDTTGTSIVTEEYEKQMMKRRISYENILDAESDIRSGYSHRPKSVGIVPGKATVLKSNASDPCILSSLGNNSLDSGNPLESGSWRIQVTPAFLVSIFD